MCRSTKITVGLLNNEASVYNGRKHVMVCVTSKHLGLKFGEFAFTKTLSYVKKNSKNVKKGHKNRKIKKK